MIIKSRRVVPGRLSDAGFSFEFNTLAEAVGELEGRKLQHKSTSGNARTEMSTVY